MQLTQSSVLGFTRGINPIPVPNQVTSKTAFVPFTDAVNNDWQGRYYPIKMADGNWMAVWLEGTFHSDYNSASHTVNIHFSNDEGVTWTNNNQYFGGGAVTGFPLVPPGGTATGFVDFCLFLAPNGDVILIAQNRGSNPGVWNNVNFSQHQYRSTDHGATWSYDGDFCDMIGETTTNAKASIQGLFETMTIGTDVYAILCQIRANLDDTRIRIYKTTNNATAWSFVSNPIEYDEVTPDCTESALAHLGNGKIICVFRTQDLGQALWKTSEDYGLTWGTVTDFAAQLGYVGLHQPRIKAYSNFFLVMGRDNKDIIDDPGAAVYQRNSWWTTEDLFATTCDRYYLDPFYAGNGTVSNGDAGYTRAVQKNDGSFMFFGYYGLNSAALIYKFDVSHTNSPSTENYSNTNFFPGTITQTGIRLQMNRDNIQVTSSPDAVAAHNTLETGGLQFATAGTLPQFQVSNDKGWLYFNSSRIVSDGSLANTFFRASFSFGFWLQPDDGQPATAQSIFRCSNLTTTVIDDVVRFQLSTDGKVLVGYAANGTSTVLVPSVAVFANGAVAERHIAVTVTSGGIIRLYVDKVLQADDGVNTGSMAAITMTNFSTTNPMYWGMRQTGASTFDLPYIGRLREFVLQPVVWTQTDIDNIYLN